MKYLLFGTGEYYKRYKIWFDRKDVIALIDNAKEKQGTYIDGIIIIAPEEIYRYDFDVIVIMSFYIKSMKAQLVELGIGESRIFHFYDLHDLIYSPLVKREVYCYGMEKNEKKEILLLNQDLTLGGPALALYHVARVLIKNGYQVVYGSMIDGPLREILIKEKIPVIVDENLLIETMKESNWVGEYPFIICNTINFHVFLSERDESIPIAWWLHDASFFYDGVNQKAIKAITNRNMKVWTVGAVSEKAIKEFRPDFQTENLLYGVKDAVKNEICLGKKVIRVEFDKIRFTVIGYIESRKGQDILVEAIRGLKANIRKKAEFYFVGANTSLLAKEIIETAKDMPELVITGLVDREEIDSILDASDMLICPSREDPMPTVAAEAMMHGIPCILSDSTGTAKYVRNGIDGIVFQSENVEQLREILEKCILHKFDLDEMGKNARKIFEEFFSMEIFEKRFMSLVKQIF